MVLRQFSSCVFAVLLVGATGCGSASTEPSDVTVFAAASLTKPFNTTQARTPDIRLHLSFGSSSALVTQITQGAMADVIATADETSMTKLVSAGLVDAPVIFATNGIVIAVQKGNPKKVAGLADLARPGVSVVLADPSVPVGAYAKQALIKAHVTVAPKSLELDTKATIGRVESGDADAAIVYATDVRASSKTEPIMFPESAGIVAKYPIAIVKATRNRAGANAFVSSARSGAVHDELAAEGFGGA